MAASKINLKSMNYKLTEIHGKPTLTFKDLFILVIIGIFIFASAGISDIFEMSLEWSLEYGAVEVGELTILSLILAFGFGIFSLHRWREVKHEMAARKRAKEKIKNTDRSLSENMKEREEFPWVVSHDLGAPVRNISDMAASIIREYGENLDADVKDRLSRIQKNGERELGLIRDSSELCRIKTEIEHFEELDTGELFQGLGDGFSRELEGEGVALSAAKANIEPYEGDVLVEPLPKDSPKGKLAKKALKGIDG